MISGLVVLSSVSGEREPLLYGDSTAPTGPSSWSRSVGSRRSTRLRGERGQRWNEARQEIHVDRVSLPEWACAGNVEEPGIDALWVEFVVAG